MPWLTGMHASAIRELPGTASADLDRTGGAGQECEGERGSHDKPQGRQQNADQGAPNRRDGCRHRDHRRATADRGDDAGSVDRGRQRGVAP